MEDRLRAGCNCSATTVCAIRSATVGLPSIRVPPPCGLGISTAFTGGGSTLPDDIRFQILYRLFSRSGLETVDCYCPSTPGAPCSL